MKQLDTLPYVYPGLGLTEIRARLCSLLAEITPGDINGFLFPLGGSEANEGAIRIARRYTGKFKIMSAMRSYHGGTTGPLAATGDFRTRFASLRARATRRRRSWRSRCWRSRLSARVQR